MESEDADRFVRESNLSIIQQYVENNVDDPDEGIRDAAIGENDSSLITGLGERSHEKFHYFIFYHTCYLHIDLSFGKVFYILSLLYSFL